jgi:transcriptional regulator with XRE-family HTH domain
VSQARRIREAFRRETIRLAEAKGEDMQIQKMRLKRGWSQQQLAEVSGTSLRTIQRVEAGAPPSLETLKSLASVFEISIEDLQGKPDMNAQEQNESHREAAAFRDVRELRRFCIHATVYVVVCTGVLIVNLLLFPEQLVAPLLWLVWGAGLLIHAVKTFVLSGSWERRQVERRLGRPL